MFLFILGPEFNNPHFLARCAPSFGHQRKRVRSSLAAATDGGYIIASQVFLRHSEKWARGWCCDERRRRVILTVLARRGPPSGLMWACDGGFTEPGLTSCERVTGPRKRFGDAPIVRRPGPRPEPEWRCARPDDPDFPKSASVPLFARTSTGCPHSRFCVQISQFPSVPAWRRK